MAGEGEIREWMMERVVDGMEDYRRRKRLAKCIS
jgi:hypothetical protein